MSATEITESPAEYLEEGKESIRALKANALGKIEDSLNFIRGKEPVGEQVKELGKAYVDLPIGTSARLLKAGYELLGAHPVEASKTASEALGRALKDVGRICLAPMTMGVAIARSGLEKTRGVVSVPKKATLRIFDTARNGGHKILNLLGGSPGTASQAPDLPPPPRAQASA